MSEIQETRTFDEQPEEGDRTVEIEETREVEIQEPAAPETETEGSDSE